MRKPIRRAVPHLVAPSLAARDMALRQAGSLSAHSSYMQAWPCMSAVEAVQPAAALRPEAFTIGAWNMERCRNVDGSAALIRQAGVDVLLASEMDVGMARSGQRNTVRDLARALGMGWVFGVEFVELRLGNRRDRRAYDGQVNNAGLHGNAILSRLPLRDAALLPLDAGGHWFVASPKGDGQRRVGGRMAICARVETGFGLLTVAATHFESESDPAGRALQAARLAGGIERTYDSGPCVLGGDLNTHDFYDTGVDRDRMLAAPGETEPAFDVFAEARFDWRASNTGLPTTRRHPDDPPDRPATSIDWLLTRDVTATDPGVVPALSRDGETLSDHELITVRIGA